MCFDGDIKYIKGRGNTSWLQDKKPYSIVFNSQVNLLDMGYSNKYCLVSSYFDMTGIRNKLVLDYASELGLDYTSNSEYVNVFINNEYQGLYLLCQSVSVNKESSKDLNKETKLEILNNSLNGLKEIKYYDGLTDSKAKNYLIEREYSSRYNSNNKNGGFVTSNNKTYVVHDSRKISATDMFDLANKVEKLEQSLYQNENKDYLEMIDLESWAKQYLIEALFQNQDAYGSSSYFYFNKEENLFYGGPVWDYDFSLGYGNASTQNPMTYNLAGCVLTWKSDLMSKVIEIFNSEIYPNRNTLIYGWTQTLSNKIKTDMYSNALRYNQQDFIESIYMFEDYDYDDSLERLQAHLYVRIEYLKKAFNNIENYRTVKFNTKNEFCGNIVYLIDNGDKFINSYSIPYLSSGDGFIWYKPLWISKWVDKDGNEFDFNKPITQDIELYAVWEGDTDANILQK